MANTQAYMGLRPVRKLDGSPYMGDLREFVVSTGYATKLYRGDPVTLSANGTIIAAGTSPIVGVFWGVQYTKSDGDITFSPYWDGVTTHSAVKAMVVADPGVIFEIQTDVNLAATDIGLSADIDKGTGSDTTGNSGAFLNTLSTDTAQVKIIGLSPRVGNEYGTYAAVEVVINESFYRGGAGV